MIFASTFFLPIYNTFILALKKKCTTINLAPKRKLILSHVFFSRSGRNMKYVGRTSSIKIV